MMCSSRLCPPGESVIFILGDSFGFQSQALAFQLLQLWAPAFFAHIPCGARAIVRLFCRRSRSFFNASKDSVTLGLLVPNLAFNFQISIKLALACSWSGAFFRLSGSIFILPTLLPNVLMACLKALLLETYPQAVVCLGADTGVSSTHRYAIVRHCVQSAKLSLHAQSHSPASHQLKLEP